MMWLLGFIGGVGALVVTLFLFPIGIAILVVVSLLRPRPASAAGACVAWGSAFLMVLWRAADRCAVLNRQPNTSCTFGDNTPFALTGIAVLAVGLLLTVYVAVRARSARRLPATP